MSDMSPDEMNVKIGEFVRDRRKEFGWSQNHLALLMRERGVLCYQNTISRVEAGAQGLKVHDALALVELFGCKLDDMLSASEPVRANYLITVAAFDMTEWQSDALFTRVTDAAHARDEQVTCSSGPLPDDEDDF